jgi:hypothetical protein
LNPILPQPSKFTYESSLENGTTIRIESGSDFRLKDKTLSMQNPEDLLDLDDYEPPKISGNSKVVLVGGNTSVTENEVLDYATGVTNTDYEEQVVEVENIEHVNVHLEQLLEAIEMACEHLSNDSSGRGDDAENLEGIRIVQSNVQSSPKTQSESGQTANASHPLRTLFLPEATLMGVDIQGGIFAKVGRVVILESNLVKTGRIAIGGVGKITRKLVGDWRKCVNEGVRRLIGGSGSPNQHVQQRQQPPAVCGSNLIINEDPELNGQNNSNLKGQREDDLNRGVNQHPDGEQKSEMSDPLDQSFDSLKDLVMRAADEYDQVLREVGTNEKGDKDEKADENSEHDEEDDLNIEALTDEYKFRFDHDVTPTKLKDNVIGDELSHIERQEQLKHTSFFPATKKGQTDKSNPLAPLPRAAPSRTDFRYSHLSFQGSVFGEILVLHGARANLSNAFLMEGSRVVCYGDPDARNHFSITEEDRRSLRRSRVTIAGEILGDVVIGKSLAVAKKSSKSNMVPSSVRSKSPALTLNEELLFRGSRNIPGNHASKRDRARREDRRSGYPRINLENHNDNYEQNLNDPAPPGYAHLEILPASSIMRESTITVAGPQAQALLDGSKDKGAEKDTDKDNEGTLNSTQNERDDPKFKLKLQPLII